MGGVEDGVHDEVTNAGFVVAAYTGLGIRGGDHGERAALTSVATFFIAAEEPTRERIAIIAEEEELHPGIGGEVIVILQDRGTVSVTGEVFSRGKGLYQFMRAVLGGE